MEVSKNKNMPTDQTFCQIYYDVITDLPNRLRLEGDLKDEIKTKPDKKKAILYIDVDDFEIINHIKGYSFGDKLMKAITQRILSLLSKKQTLYKSAGENFIIFVEEYEREEEVNELAVLVVQNLRKVFDIEDYKINISVKIGMAFYPKNGIRSIDLLNNARSALYKGRRKNRNKIWVCDFKDNNRKDSNIFMITQDLYNAIEEKEIQLHYQPQFDLRTRKITGFEALARWRHPKLDFISPEIFIDIAEKTGLIIPMGEQILINACIFLKKLHNRGYRNISISVNVSAVQLLDREFYKNVIKTIDLINLEAKFLELEITESVLIKEFKFIVNYLKKLRKKGIKIAMDDFGKGYSSLAYLKNIPADTLKIDKIFIDDIKENDNNPKLIDSIIILGRNMGFNVLAEGVETKYQMNYLQKKGCHKVQGYYISKPLPEEKAMGMLKKL